jgi:signal transduction histidine kinase/CheY-like chemotaxis protein
MLIVFSMIVFFVFLEGFTGVTNLNNPQKPGLQAIRNVIMLNDLRDSNASIAWHINSLLFVNDAANRKHILETIDELQKKLILNTNNYLAYQNDVAQISPPGAMQSISNIAVTFDITYKRIINEIFDSMARGQMGNARSVYQERFIPIYNSTMYYLNYSHNNTLVHSEAVVAQNNEHASTAAYLMLSILIASLAASLVLANLTTKSIADPLLELVAVVKKVGKGEPVDDLYDFAGNDEIYYLSQKLNEMFAQISQVQELKVEAVRTRYEKERAEVSSRAKSDFLTKVSNEIQVPMDTIAGMAELALNEELPPAVSQHIQAIKNAGVDLLSIINDILDFSKLRAGDAGIVPRGYLFSSLINDVVSIIRMRVFESQLQFTVNIDHNLPNALFGDEIRVRQVLLNILSNAVKFTESGDVSLTITGSRIEDDTVMLTMAISDSGRGIKEEDLGNLFDGFVRIDLDSNRDVVGTGLGLSTTKRLVEAMGGEIFVDSKYGEGSVFTVTIPQKVCDERPLAFVENAGELSVLVYETRKTYSDSIICTIDNLGVVCHSAITELEFREKLEGGAFNFVFVASHLFENVKDICTKLATKTRIVLLAGFGDVIASQNLSVLSMPVHSISMANIFNGLSSNYSYNENVGIAANFIAPDATALVVDDTNTNLVIVKSLLSLYEIKTNLCHSGTEALEAVKSKEYDFVLMDHMMPEMDGIETAAHIRELGNEDPYFTKLPIIALTANLAVGVKEMFLKNNFDDFLPKPIDVLEMNSVLGKWIPLRKIKQSPNKPMTVSTNAARNIEVEGLDVKKGIHRSGGTLEKYFQILGTFLRDGLEISQEIKTCLETDNLPLYAAYAHALKSSAGNVGAEKLSEIAAVLETAAREEDTAFIRTHNSKLLLVLDSVMKSISSVLSANKHSGLDFILDIPALNSCLLNLRSAMSDSDPAAIRPAVKDLQQFTQAPQIGESVANILQHTLIGKYNEAIAMINNLLLYKK